MNGRDDFPRPRACRVSTTARVVGVEARSEVMRQADIGPLRLRHTPKNVDDVLDWHSADGRKAVAETSDADLPSDPRRRVRSTAESVRWRRRAVWQFLRTSNEPGCGSSVRLP